MYEYYRVSCRGHMTSNAICETLRAVALVSAQRHHVLDLLRRVCVRFQPTFEFLADRSSKCYRDPHCHMCNIYRMDWGLATCRILNDSRASNYDSSSFYTHGHTLRARRLDRRNRRGCPSSGLKNSWLQVIRSSETSVHILPTLRCIPEDGTFELGGPTKSWIIIWELLILPSLLLNVCTVPRIFFPNGRLKSLLLDDKSNSCSYRQKERECHSKFIFELRGTVRNCSVLNIWCNLKICIKLI
jgi:hypothetical protein